jgi:hypothetical protein
MSTIELINNATCPQYDIASYEQEQLLYFFDIKSCKDLTKRCQKYISKQYPNTVLLRDAHNAITIPYHVTNEYLAILKRIEHDPEHDDSYSLIDFDDEDNILKSEYSTNRGCIIDGYWSF